jgi:hypothetical protein
MKSYVVIARFDAETERRILELQNKLTGCSIPDWPPHITIAAYENFEEDLLCKWTSEFSSKHKKMEIALNSLSILPPGGEHTETAVLCLDPAHSKPFVDFYYSFHEKYEEFCTGIGQFNSIVNDSPVIHATIGIVGVKELQKAMELVFSSGVFGQAEIMALEVYELPKRLFQRYTLSD